MSDPLAVVRLEKVAGDQQTGLAQTALADSIVVRAVNAQGNPVLGARVTFTTTSGLVRPDSSFTNASGVVRAQLTLGSGNATVTANVGPVSSTFSAVAGAPASLILSNAGNNDLNEGATDTLRSLRASGRIRALMFFVDFSDAPQSETITALSTQLVPPTQAWMQSASYGRVTLDVNVVQQWFRMPRTAASYGFGAITFASHRQYIADAIAAADAAIDFAPYQLIYIVASNTQSIPASPTFTNRAGLGVMADGVEHRQVITAGADVRLPNNYGSFVLAHETGHVFGLPDLYAFNNPSGQFAQLFRFTGGWDIMSWVAPGADFLGWHKRKLGWLDADQVKALASGGIEVVLTPIETANGLKLVVAPISASKAYVIEVRRIVDNSRNLCDQGVLIYTVDASVRTGEGPVQVLTTNNGNAQAMISRCGLLYDAPFDSAQGEANRFQNADITVEVMSVSGSQYRVRVRR